MPTCVVPQCNNTKVNSQCSFYRFPVDEIGRRKWIKSIRRINYKYSHNDRICSWHFPNGKEQGPTRFSWSEGKSFILNFPDSSKEKRANTLASKREMIIPSTSMAVNGVPRLEKLTSSKRKQVLEKTMYLSPKKAVLTKLTPRITKSTINHQLCMTENQLTTQKAQTRYFEVEVDRLYKEKREVERKMKLMVNEVTELRKALNDANEKLGKLQLENTKNQQKSEAYKEVRCELSAIKMQVKSLEKLNIKLVQEVKALQDRNHCDGVCQKFNVDKIKTWNSTLLSSFTGFQDYSSIQLLCNILLHKNVVYNRKSEVMKVSFTHQIIITLMKLKLDLPHSALGYIFGISKATVSIIFNAFLEAMYQVYYEGEGILTKIPSRFKNAESLPACFSDMPNCRIVIDCTEFQTETPPTLEQKKSIYSHYKGRYTTKILVGCAPNGTVTFVSNLFGGSESDKSIVVKSNLLDQMEAGDMILADKGFQLYDILPPGVSLNIPSFLVSNQFTVNEIVTNNMYATARVIIERLNARFKVFKILNVLKGKNLNKADKIIKVCIALTTLTPTLMCELHAVA